MNNGFPTTAVRLLEDTLSFSPELSEHVLKINHTSKVSPRGIDPRRCCSCPEKAGTRAVVSREEENGINLRNIEEVESADLVIQWL